MKFNTVNNKDTGKIELSKIGNYFLLEVLYTTLIHTTTEDAWF
jgi:hypothetical protein